jgi:AcrR family transcriptional regulator
MPTGVPIGDARERLFDAADRLLLRGGPSAVTSRAVTEEAWTAKGLLHRHFEDFDGFLAEFVLDRAQRMDERAAALRGAVGTGTVTGNLAEALTVRVGRSGDRVARDLPAAGDLARGRTRAHGRGRHDRRLPCG